MDYVANACNSMIQEYSTSNLITRWKKSIPNRQFGRNNNLEESGFLIKGAFDEKYT